MEKFSAYRDPGTGIQPFLTPVPPLGSEWLAKIVLPFGYILAIVRTTLALFCLLLYLIIVRGVCLIFIPIPPIHRIISFLFTATLSRLVLALVGLLWIPVENVTRKRGRGVKTTESWNPRAGDIIVSNWVSWIEILWLASRFNPIFVIPVSKNVAMPQAVQPSAPITHTPGRRTGTGSANISSSTRAPSTKVPILGFRQVTLLSMLRFTGNVPPSSDYESGWIGLEDIRMKADRPLVVFPECTTSNGRGMLRFADVFAHLSVPVKKFQVFVMCVRYDPPTNLTPTLTHAIPSLTPILNPLGHLFNLTICLTPQTISMRLLAPSESPSSPLFMVNEVVTFSSNEDQLAEACATLIAQIGKMKRTGMGWEDKAAFLEFYRGKRSSK